MSIINTYDHSRFWAKIDDSGNLGISVYQHMLNVGCVAKELAETKPNILKYFNIDSSMIGALAALHDLGKISPGFQQKWKGWLSIEGLRRVAEMYHWDSMMEL